MDRIAHCYPWIQPTVLIEGIRISSIDDIAAMKFNAIVQDGSRLKDFIDIYVLLEHKSLAELFSFYERKYPNVSALTARKALLYHNDVKQTQKLDLVKQNISWQNVVKRLRQANIDPHKIFKPENELFLHQKTRLSRGRRIR